MKIILAGYGFVGKAVFNALKNKHNVVIVDPEVNTNKIRDYEDAEGIILCLPSPTNDNGVCDVNIITSVLDQVPTSMPVLIKSTVTPGIVEALYGLYPDHKIVYNPEFLRARTAEQDFLNQKFIVLGGEDTDAFWQGVLQEALPMCTLVFNCSAQEASLIKYSINSFLAVKTSFFNQINDICELTGMDYSVVRQIISHDSRIGSDHTLVPGPDGERGWGGACFPKDTAAFIQWATTIGTPQTILEETVKYNRLIRTN